MSLFTHMALRNTSAACVALVIAYSQETLAYVAEWSLTVADGLVVATDCGDCEEEIGIMISCRGAASPAEVIIHAAASEVGRAGETAPVWFDLDGDRFVRSATTVEFGMIGYTPVFQLASDDPLIHALERSHEAVVTFNGVQSLIGLKGSKRVLDGFRNRCGWPEHDAIQRTPNAAEVSMGETAPSNRSSVSLIGQREAVSTVQHNAGNQRETKQDQTTGAAREAGVPSQLSPQVPSQTPVREAPAVPDSEGLFWFTGDGFGGGSTKTIRYGVPETDTVILFASCDGTGESKILLEVYTDVGDAPTGNAVSVEISHVEGVSRFAGSTFIASEEYAGSRFYLPWEVSLWKSIANSPEVSIGVVGARKASLRGADGAPALAEFMRHCGA